MILLSNKMSERSKRIILGLHEYVDFVVGKRKYRYLAKVDTGAARSSVDYDIAEFLQLGPEIKRIKVKSALGEQNRKVIRAKIIIRGIEVETSFSVSPRKHLKRRVLIGVNTLRKIKALVDPLKDIKE